MISSLSNFFRDRSKQKIPKLVKDSYNNCNDDSIQPTPVKGIYSGILRLVIVKDMIAWMNLYARHVEGIFRKEGQASVIRDLCEQCQMEERVLFGADLDGHTMAGVLKLYFREAERMLIPREFYDEFIDLVDVYDEDHEMGVQMVKGVLEKLPEEHVEMICVTLWFLDQVVKDEVTLMNPNNLSICFGASIMKNPDPLVMDFFSISRQSRVFEILIQHFEDIFPDYEPEFNETLESISPLPSIKFSESTPISESDIEEFNDSILRKASSVKERRRSDTQQVSRGRSRGGGDIEAYDKKKRKKKSKRKARPISVRFTPMKMPDTDDKDYKKLVKGLIEKPSDNKIRKAIMLKDDGLEEYLSTKSTATLTKIIFALAEFNQKE